MILSNRSGGYGLFISIILSLSSMVTVAMAGVVMPPVDNMAVNISVSSGVVSSKIITFTVSSVCPGARAFSLGVASKSDPAVDFIMNQYSVGGKKEYYYVTPVADSDVRDTVISTKFLTFPAFIISSTNSSTPSVTV